MNFSTTQSPERPNGIEYIQVIRVGNSNNEKGYTHRPNGQTLDNIILANPGATWFIGNEPDRRDWSGGGQDEILPERYAQVYHELYHHLKSLDPTAKIFAGSIVQPTDLRLEYLDLVLSAYRARYGTLMPVDGWSIHNYILNEVSCRHFSSLECWGADVPPGIDKEKGMTIDAQQNDDYDIFVAQIQNFRRWMTRRGYHGLPVYLSEYGVLMPEGIGFDPDFTQARVSNFMTKTFDYLLTEAVDPVHGNPADGYRLVQRFFWYSVSDTGFNGRLFEPDTQQRTLMGDTYAAYVSGIAEEADFAPVRILVEPTPWVEANEPVTVTVKATIGNAGNTMAAHDVRVRFYHGDPAAGGAQIGADQIASLSGCGDTETVEVMWKNVVEGAHPVYVRVDPAPGSAALEPEDAKANNIASRVVVIGGEALFAPSIFR